MQITFSAALALTVNTEVAESYSLIGDKVLRVAHASLVDDKLPEVPASIINDRVKITGGLALALVLVAAFAWRALVLGRVPILVDIGLPKKNPHEDHRFVPICPFVLVVWNRIHWFVCNVVFVYNAVFLCNAGFICIAVFTCN